MKGKTIAALLLAIQICASNSFSVIYNNEQGGRKLFGGYRISPKACTVAAAKGICMFNYECSLRRGAMLGSCMDGFLFGTCCQLPPGSAEIENSMFIHPPLEEDDDDLDSTGEGSSDAFYQTTFTGSFTKPQHLRPPNTNQPRPTLSPAVNELLVNPLYTVDTHPEADTILFHKNGSAVHDFSNPDELFKPLRGDDKPDKPGSSEEFSTFSYINNPESNETSYELVSESNSNSQESSENEVATKPGFFITKPGNKATTMRPTATRATTEGKYTSYSTNSYSDKIELLKPYDVHEKSTQWPWTTQKNKQTTITAEEVASTKTTDFTPSYYSSRWPTNQPRPTISFRPRPTTPSTLHPSDNMILVQTLDSANTAEATYTQSSLAPNSDSINSIISMLDENNPVEMASSESSENSNKMSSKQPGIYTWASLNTQSTTNKYKRPTTPTSYYDSITKRPSQVEHLNVAGPSFEVIPEQNPNPPPPTVIVLGPFASDFTTSRPHPPSRKPIIISSTNSVKVTNKPVNNRPYNPTVTVINGIITKRPTTTPSGIITKRPSTSNFGIKRPSSPVVNKRPTTPTPLIVTRGPTTTEEVFETATSVADLANFPPVRNPSLNTSRPTLASYTNKPISDIEIFTPPPNVNYVSSSEEDQVFEENTPIFIEDDKLNAGMDVFVNKIVQSLQGNFQDLEDVLYQKNNGSSVGIPTSKRPIALADDVPTTSRPRPRPTPTKRPVKPVATRPRPTTTTTTTTVKPRPRPTTTKKPVTKPTSGTTSRPFRVSTEQPTTKKPTRPVVVTTKKPSPPRRTTQKPTTVEVTTKRPRPVVVTTRKPKPPRKTTVAPIVEEADEYIEVATKPPRKTTTTTTTTTTEATSSEEDDEEISEEEDEYEVVKPQDYRRDCGVRPLMKKKNGRIVGGKGATFGEWPWQVLVRESTWLGLFTKNKCGGVLITNKYVVTAAHCQPGFLANLVAVFGEFDISGDLESKRSITKNVRRVIVHRHYDAATFANDLALLELDSAVSFDQHIVPICMPEDGEDFTGRMATVSGWGRLKYGGGVPSVLQEVQVPIIENHVCQDMFQTAGHAKTILDSFLCAGYANGQKDSCEGDSGGPLMLERDDGRWTLAGTVSHGIKCAAPYLPGVYMRTTFYKPWLKSITGVDNSRS